MNSIHTLAGLDLNLLVAFTTLYDTRSVTRTASELGKTQSAMSHTLGRLRDRLGDPLFVRSGRAMAPTPFADALAGPVRVHLEGLARALEAPGSFDPATSTRRFALASIDLFDALVVPQFMRSLRSLAPGVTLAMRPHNRQTVAGLDQGELDAAIHPVLLGTGPDPLPTQGLRRQTLLRDRFTLFARRGHPRAEAMSRDVDAFCAGDHVLVTPGGGPGLVDLQLAARGRVRRVALELAGFAAALPVLESTDLVLVGPEGLARLAGPTVACWPVPLQLPEHLVTLVWSERLHADAGHRWFRSVLAASVRERVET